MNHSFMSLICPICRAANDARSTCRRCRADLSLCAAIEAQREHAIAAARSAVAAGRVSDAVANANYAAALRRGQDTEELLAALQLLAGDFAAAWNRYARAAASFAVPLPLQPRIMEPS
jgi:hypothetical protein